MFDLDLSHNAQSTKDRSSLFDGRLVSKPDEKIGKLILEWLENQRSEEHTSELQSQVTISYAVNGSRE